MRADLETFFLELTAGDTARRTDGEAPMIRLLGVELTRLRWRRAVLVLLLLAAAWCPR